MIIRCGRIDKEYYCRFVTYPSILEAAGSEVPLKNISDAIDALLVATPQQQIKHVRTSIYLTVMSSLSIFWLILVITCIQYSVLS
jgi:hypothetical protein